MKPIKSGGSPSPIYQVAPGDLSFGWSDCLKCFWRKVRLNQRRPSTPMASVYTRIHGCLQNEFMGERVEGIITDLPPGQLVAAERWVKSKPIVVEGSTSLIQIRGRFDAVVKFDDGTYAIIDFKTAITSEINVPLYGRQLHSYVVALENPDPGSLGFAPINRIGLYCVEPTSLADLGDGDWAYRAKHVWIEVPIDREGFAAFLAEVVALLDGDEPAPSPGCAYCTFRES